MNKKSSASKSSSSTSSTGTSTITSSLKAQEMPKFPDDFVSAASSSSSMTLSSYIESEEDESRMGAGCDRSKSPEDLLLSLNDDTNDNEKKSYKSTSDEEICCKHGRPCVIGRKKKAAAASVAAVAPAEKSKYKIVSQYETVKISKLENPPASFTRRRRASSPTKNDSDLMEDQPIVYHCKYPSELSSIATPSSLDKENNNDSNSDSKDSTDGVYENIDCLNKSQKPISPAISSTDTARSGSRANSSYAVRRRRYKNASSNTMGLYFGAMIKRDAEKRVKKNTHFGLYHRIPSNASKNLDSLKDHIYLYIVYKSSKGDYFHYPIQRCRGTPSCMKSGKQYYIDCEDTDRVVFNTLDALINYYSVYVCVDITDEHADVFPIPTKYKNRERKSVVIREEEDDDDTAATMAESKRKQRQRRSKKSEKQIYY